MHPTLETFGYPETVIHAYEHWTVLLRPAQVTVGSLVLAHNGLEERFGDVPAPAFAEMAAVTGHIESTLRAVFAFDKINYLMLMMRDPQVHFHVIPRYARPVSVGGGVFPDRGWPKQPLLGEPVALTAEQFEEVRRRLRDAWPA